MKRTIACLLLSLLVFSVFASGELRGLGTGSTPEEASDAARRNLLGQFNVSFISYTYINEKLNDDSYSKDILDKTMLHSNIKLDILPIKVQKNGDGSFSASCTISVSELPVLLNQMAKRLSEVSYYELRYKELCENNNLSSLNMRISNSKQEMEALEEADALQTILRYFNCNCPDLPVSISELRNREDLDLMDLDIYLNSYKNVNDISSGRIEEIRLAQQLYAEERKAIDESREANREAFRFSVDQIMEREFRQLKESVRITDTGSGEFSIEKSIRDVESIKRKLFEFSVSMETQLMSYLDSLEKDYLFDSYLIETREYMSSELCQDGSVSETARLKRDQELKLLSDEYEFRRSEIENRIRGKQKESEKEIEATIWDALKKIVSIHSVDNISNPENVSFRYESYDPDRFSWKLGVDFKLFDIVWEFNMNVPFRLFFPEDWKVPAEMTMEEYNSYNDKVAMMSEYLMSEDIIPLVIALELEIHPQEDSYYRIEFKRMTFALPDKVGQRDIGHADLDRTGDFHFVIPFRFSSNEELESFSRQVSGRPSSDSVPSVPKTQVEADEKSAVDEAIRGDFKFRATAGAIAFDDGITPTLGVTAEYQRGCFGLGLGLELRPIISEAVLFGEISSYQSLFGGFALREWIKAGIRFSGNTSFLISPGISLQYERFSFNLGCEFGMGEDGFRMNGIGMAFGLSF